MNPTAAYLLVAYRMDVLQAEAEHARLASVIERERMAHNAFTERRSVLRRVASNVRRRIASGVDDTLVAPPVPALTDYPYRS